MRSNNRAPLFAVVLTSVLIAAPAAGAQTSGAQVMVPPAATQDAIITGKVTSIRGQPLERAEVLIQSLSVAVTTDAQGNYRIVIPAVQANGQRATMRIRLRDHGETTVSIRVTPGMQIRRITLPGLTVKILSY